MEEKFLHKQHHERENICGLDDEGAVSSPSSTYYDRFSCGKHLISDYTLLSNVRCTEKSYKCRDSTTSSGTDLVEYKSQDLNELSDLGTSHFVCTSAPPLGFSLNLTLSKRFQFKLHRRTKSANCYGDAFRKYAPTFYQGGLRVSPAAKWIVDPVEADENAESCSNDSTVVHLADLHTKEVKLSDFNRSPSLRFTAVERQCGENHLGKRSPSKMSDLTFISSSSSTCSYQSEWSEVDLVSKGLLRCIWKDELPYFVFSLSEEHGEVYFAKPLKKKSLFDKVLDYVYMFYSRTSSKKGGSSSYIYHFVGKMTVSSYLSFTSNNSKLVETEFVLFDANVEKKDLVGASIGSLRSKSFHGKKLNIFRQTGMNFQSSSRCGDADVELDYLLKEPSFYEFSQFAGIHPSNFLERHFLPNFEMLAIVIKDRQRCKKTEKTFGGWGLKFLDMDNGSSTNQSDERLGCSELGTIEDNYTRSMNVIIPAGFHGGPSTKQGGPSCLIERWKMRGCCDCGGWDMGCPLTVLHNQPTSGIMSLVESSREDHKLVNLIVEGAKQGEPSSLRITMLNEKLYSVYYQSKFSALQAFSVGVATIHSQSRALQSEL